MTVKSFLRHKALHGFPWTAAHYGFRALRKVTACEILRVFVSDGSPVGDGQVEGYVTRELMPDEVQGCPLILPQGQEFAAAMAGGARCFVNIFGHRVVGYTFYSRQSVPLRPGLSLTIPPECDYSHGSYTAPDHRGKGLAMARADSRKIADRQAAVHRPLAWYVAVDNRASIAVCDRIPGARVVGHTAYIALGRKFFVKSSAACKKLGFSLEC